MPTIWLILSSLVLPLVWGWAVHRLMAWLWPEQEALAATRIDRLNRADPLADYQI